MRTLLTYESREEASYNHKFLQRTVSGSITVLPSYVCRTTIICFLLILESTTVRIDSGGTANQLIEVSPSLKSVSDGMTRPDFSEPSTQQETYLIRIVRQAHSHWGYFIANHITAAIIIPIILSVVCGAKVISTP